MSCLHIEGKRRSGDGAPLRYTGKKNRIFEVEQNAKHENPRVRASAAASPHASRDTLDRLAADPADEVREWVARNKVTDKQTLRELAEDTNPRVRAFVAWNPTTPILTVKFLTEDAVEVVRQVAKVALDSRS